jgi:LuxR family transcriptional regulator, maltose regulon positive regulatory protein
MQKADPLIRTKLRLPSTRKELVARPRLQERVARGLRGPLTLITAPAGFGKTTLVASFIAGCGLTVAWLSLDKNDNQSGRFLGYLVAALQEANPALGRQAAQLVATGQPVPPEIILTDLINDLDLVGEAMVLVLDDYQHIISQAVHGAVEFLLEHCPRDFHLLIATRSDPPLPLARLQGRGQLVELRAAELRFTAPEAAQFLNQVMGLQLDESSVELLAERTEGWIAGLQMAALSMRDREDVSVFIREFSGTNRYILDYLLEEVLAREPEEVQAFLLQTAFLTRLSGPLCEAVTALPGGQEMLERLERRNLFVVPLDDERRWYRYHHLFADLLRARLDKLYPGLAASLHSRAAAWLEGEGMALEAVNHALAAGEYEYAARLVEENTGRLLAQGELNALMSWIEMLPADVRMSRPSLCVHQALALMFAGRAAEVEILLAQAEAGLKTGSATCEPPPGASASETEVCPALFGEERTIRSLIAVVRAYTAVYLGLDEVALTQAQLARDLLGADDVSNRAVVAWSVGRTLQNQGRLSEARLAFEEHVRLGRASRHIWGFLAGMTALARALQCQGQLTEARALLDDALAEAAKEGARGRGFIAWVNTGLASVLYEQDELDSAERLLIEAIELIRKWPNSNHLIYAYTLIARVCLARADLPGARSAIAEAELIHRRAPLSRWLRYSAEAQLVRVWLAYQAAGVDLLPGDPLAEQAGAVVDSWQIELLDASALSGRDDTPMDEGMQLAALAQARVLLAAGRAEQALRWLEPVTRRTRAAGYVSIPIESLLLTALMLQSQRSQPRPGFTALEEALCLAQPGGHVRIFLDEGKPMQLLLEQWLAHERAHGLAHERAHGLAHERAHGLAHTGPGPLREYALYLLSKFDAEPHKRPAVQGRTAPAGEAQVRSEHGLVEALTERELEVLHLVALGQTNQEIARQLIVSPGTVKAHTSSIYRKLMAANRTEAVARARGLGIIS